MVTTIAATLMVYWQRTTLHWTGIVTSSICPSLLETLNWLALFAFPLSLSPSFTHSQYFNYSLNTTMCTMYSLKNRMNGRMNLHDFSSIKKIVKKISPANKNVWVLHTALIFNWICNNPGLTLNSTNFKITSTTILLLSQQQ